MERLNLKKFEGNELSKTQMQFLAGGLGYTTLNGVQNGDYVGQNEDGSYWMWCYNRNEYLCSPTEESFSESC